VETIRNHRFPTHGHSPEVWLKVRNNIISKVHVSLRRGNNVTAQIRAALFRLRKVIDNVELLEILLTNQLINK
jgi:hypothetical protein